jgi:hypothetical protein
LICSRSGWRKKSPSGTGVFGPIHTSSGFAGFAHQYACFLQIQQYRFGFTGLLRPPRSIVQGRLSSAEAESTTFTEALDRYEREIASNKRGAVREKSLIRMLRDSSLAQRSLAAIRRADVAKLRDEWCETHSPATVVRRLALISHLFTIARKEWGLESLSNPVS